MERKSEITKKMKKIVCAFFLATLLFVCSIAALPTQTVVAGVGSDIITQLNDVGQRGGFVLRNAETSLPYQIGIIIRGVIGFLGVVFLVLVVFAGYKWMLAHGEPGEVKEAQKLLIHSIVGLIITVAAYALSSFVVNAISSAAF